MTQRFKSTLQNVCTLNLVYVLEASTKYCRHNYICASLSEYVFGCVLRTNIKLFQQIFMIA